MSRACRSTASGASSTGSPSRATRTTSATVSPLPLRTTVMPTRPARRRDEGGELGALVLLRERVAEDRRGEAALRREREPLERRRRPPPRARAPRARPRSRAARLFVVTRPRTTSLSSGTCASGSKEPERSSSYSSRSRSACTPREEARRDPVVAARDEPARAWFPRQRCKPNVTPGWSSMTRLSSSRPRSSQRSAGQPRLS